MTNKAEHLTIQSGIQFEIPLGVKLFWSEPQARERRNLYKNFEQIFCHIPDVNMDFEKALEDKLVDSHELAIIYNNLSNFIKADSNNARIILYLPSQFLPNLNSNKHKSNELIDTQNKFAASYKDAWIRLLFESEVRAIFVDGDVLEPGMGAAGRVRKAAHLLPDILQKNLISLKEVENIREIASQDQELFQSINEGLGIGKKPSSPDNHKNISPKRKQWLEQVKQEQLIDQQSDILALKLLTRQTDTKEIDNVIGITSIFKTKRPTEEYLKIIEKNWENATDEIKDCIISGLNHWAKLNIVSKDYLESLDIRDINLSSPFPVNLDKLTKEDFKDFVLAAEKIKNNPKLSEYIYPLFLAFGSRVKGYATSTADHDAAIFFKPNTPFSKREEILTLLKQEAPELNDVDKILEFWLSQKDGKLEFKPVPENSETIIGTSQIHIFLGGIWIGDKNEYQKIYNDITQTYRDLSHFGDKQEEVRFQFLRQLELDVLQCRLMHKGYRRFYPSRKDEGPANAHLIDWNSDYWDSGYRRVATQLFLSRVFLPKTSIT